MTGPSQSSWRQWWIGIRLGRWGFGIWLDGHTMRWLDPQDMWGVVIGKSDR